MSSETEQLPDIERVEDVKTFVDSFYGKIQQDELLGPIFAGRIKDWGPHLERMYTFWSSILLATNNYSGQPFPKHLGLGVQAKHFERWLFLFEQNMEGLFSGPLAKEAVDRAKSIAQIFSFKIESIEG